MREYIPPARGKVPKSGVFWSAGRVLYRVGVYGESFVPGVVLVGVCWESFVPSGGVLGEFCTGDAADGGVLGEFFAEEPLHALTVNVSMGVRSPCGHRSSAGGPLSHAIPLKVFQVMKPNR